MIEIKESIDNCNIFFAYKLKGYDLEEPWQEMYVISDDIENVAAFIAGNKHDNFIITRVNDEFVMNTLTGYIDRIYDQEYLNKLLKVLIPMQIGETEIPDFKCITALSYLSDSSQEMSM